MQRISSTVQKAANNNVESKCMDQDAKLPHSNIKAATEHQIYITAYY